MNVGMNLARASAIPAVWCPAPGPIHPQPLRIVRPWHGFGVGPSPQFYPGRPRQDVLPFPFDAVGQATVPTAFFCRNRPIAFWMLL
jgi:hypothetical protein